MCLSHSHVYGSRWVVLSYSLHSVFPSAKQVLCFLSQFVNWFICSGSGFSLDPGIQISRVLTSLEKNSMHYLTSQGAMLVHYWDMLTDSSRKPISTQMTLTSWSIIKSTSAKLQKIHKLCVVGFSHGKSLLFV